jgi:transaldolase
MQELTAIGQSIWLDNIRRSMFATGELRKLIDEGLRGMTSNPTIFEKAIGTGNDYDAQLRDLISSERDPQHLFEQLAIQDIRSACDEFRALYDSSNGGDGFVSLEVSPTLANDTPGTIAAAKRLWAAVDRPNVMIKIPGTAEGVPAITAVIAAGINVNVTLLFSVDRYEAAAKAYIEGIEQRSKAGHPVDHVASVASVFISRIDTAISCSTSGSKRVKSHSRTCSARRGSRIPNSSTSATSSSSRANGSPRRARPARTFSVRSGRRPAPRTRPTPT